MEDEIICSICGDLIPIEESHNAQPVSNGRCCSYCNEDTVIPTRIELMCEEEFEEEENNENMVIW